MALKLGAGQGNGHDEVVQECTDNESVSANEDTVRTRKSPDGRVEVEAILHTDNGKRAFVVVRITSTEVANVKVEL